MIQIHVCVVTLQPIHGNEFSFISLLKSSTRTASDTSALISLLSTAFHIMSPLYLMPVFPKSDITARIWKSSSVLVSWLWYSLFLWTRYVKLSGTLAVAYRNIKWAIRYPFRSINLIIPSCLYNDRELSPSLSVSFLQSYFEELLVFANLSYRRIPICDCNGSSMGK